MHVHDQIGHTSYVLCGRLRAESFIVTQTDWRYYIPVADFTNTLNSVFGLYSNTK